MNTVSELSANFNPATTSADALFELGMKYCLGREVSQSYIEAHKWFNIAALKGNDAAKFYRSDISREMTAADIAEAQRQARSMLTLH
jgi:TPR repeat protein